MSDYVAKAKAYWGVYEDFFVAHPKTFSVLMIVAAAYAVFK